MMLRVLSPLLALFALILAEPVIALVPASETPAEPATESSSAITPEAGTNSDELIADRLENIFSEIPDLAAVKVAVDEGVVSLSGSIPEEDAIERAANIAARVSGVVTVENNLERDVSVDTGIDVLQNVTDRAGKWLEMMPLVLTALLVALIIAAFGYIIASFGAFWKRIAPNIFMAELVRSAIRFGFVICGLVVALDLIGAGALLGTVLGSAGVLGLALGFAMRDTVENYVASLFLSLRQPFRANDHVLIDDKEGRVMRLTSRATILMTLDGNHLRMPNAQVYKSVIVNYTTNPFRRLSFELGVDADDDASAASKLGRETLAGLSFVLNEPKPEARIESVGDSNVVIRYLAWIDQREADWSKARSRAIIAAKHALEEGGFGLPEPIYRLRFDPRTDPLPFKNIESKATQSNAKNSPKPKPKSPSSQSALPLDDDDLGPQDDIAEMIKQGRQTEDDTDRDLLDPSKPVE